ncbi:MAG: 23S rRNA (adenine(2503)-C(2))-methyltransferase RlmN, partial [Myxococcota bacterium]
MSESDQSNQPDGESVDLRALNLAETVAFAQDRLGQPRYRGEQLWRWVHGAGARSFDEMSNLSKALRAQLSERAHLGTLTVDTVQTSRDGTRKMRLLTRDGQSIESVLIPDGDKLTQCISSQVGCALDCQFCATAKMGLRRNLDAGEIVDQVYRARALLA